MSVPRRPPRRTAPWAAFGIAVLLGVLTPIATRAHEGEAMRGAQTSARPAPTKRRPTRRRPAQAKRRPRGPAITPAYRAMRARWHRAAAASAVRRWEAKTPPPLVLRPVNQPTYYELVPEGDQGGFDGEAAVAARKALASREGTSCDVHPRLLELVYRAVRHFRAPYVHVISGYRETRRTSRHNQCRAIDFVLPGVSDARLVRFLRRQGFVGVGQYPVSGFVHLDVRAKSFFWVDRSAPQRGTRPRQVAAAEARLRDAQAARRGEEIVPDVEGMSDAEGGGADAVESASDAGADAR